MSSQDGLDSPEFEEAAIEAQEVALLYDVPVTFTFEEWSFTVPAGGGEITVLPIERLN